MSRTSLTNQLMKGLDPFLSNYKNGWCLIMRNSSSWLESRVDQILIGCTMQLRLQYSSQDRSLKDIIQGYKALLRLLMAVSPVPFSKKFVRMF
jgi:hypothetical protein